jgi:hypothetical protein
VFCLRPAVSISRGRCAAVASRYLGLVHAPMPPFPQARCRAYTAIRPPALVATGQQPLALYLVLQNAYLQIIKRWPLTLHPLTLFPRHLVRRSKHLLPTAGFSGYRYRKIWPYL